MTNVMPTPKQDDSSSGRDQKFRAATFRNTLRPGFVVLYPGTVAPEGWISCAGTAINRTVYAELFKLCGTTFGAGDGSTTFNIPNWNASAPANGIYIMKV